MCWCPSLTECSYTYSEVNINLKITKSNDNIIYFVNDNLLPKIYTDLLVNGIETFSIIDDDYILLTQGEGGLYYLFGKNGNYINQIKSKFEHLSVEDLKYSNNTFFIYSVDYIGDYEASLCSEHKKDDIAYSEEKTSFNKGILEEPIVISTKTVDKIIKSKYKMSCDELKNTTDPDLEYAKYLAIGEE